MGYGEATLFSSAKWVEIVKYLEWEVDVNRGREREKKEQHNHQNKTRDTSDSRKFHFISEKKTASLSKWSVYIYYTDIHTYAYVLIHDISYFIRMCGIDSIALSVLTVVYANSNFHIVEGILFAFTIP